MKLLSIIVPVFNEELHLNAVIDYLMKSKCPIAREWIFVDDCSTDHSLKMLKSAQEKYHFVL